MSVRMFLGFPFDIVYINFPSLRGLSLDYLRRLIHSIVVSQRYIIGGNLGSSGQTWSTYVNKNFLRQPGDFTYFFLLWVTGLLILS